MRAGKRQAVRRVDKEEGIADEGNACMPACRPQHGIMPCVAGGCMGRRAISKRMVMADRHAGAVSSPTDERVVTDPPCAAHTHLNRRVSWLTWRDARWGGG